MEGLRGTAFAEPGAGFQDLGMGRSTVVEIEHSDPPPPAQRDPAGRRPKVPGPIPHLPIDPCRKRHRAEMFILDVFGEVEDIGGQPVIDPVEHRGATAGRAGQLPIVNGVHNGLLGFVAKHHERIEPILFETVTAIRAAGMRRPFMFDFVMFPGRTPNRGIGQQERMNTVRVTLVPLR